MSAQGGVCGVCGGAVDSAGECMRFPTNCKAIGYERLQSALREAREEVEALKAKAYAPAAQSLAENQGRAEGPKAVALRAAKLEAALRRYGEHELNCPSAFTDDLHGPCVCGLTAALAAEQGNAPSGAHQYERKAADLGCPDCREQEVGSVAEVKDEG